MAQRASAKYQFGLDVVRFLPHNADHTVPTSDNVFSSVGPWDFSGADDTSAVEMFTRVDTGVLVTRYVNLSGVSDITAVTAEELRTAILSASVTAYTEYDIRVTTSGDIRVTTNGDTRVVVDQPLDFTVVGDRLQVSWGGLGSVDWIQVFGDVAELSGFGQGFGLWWITCDTISSFNESKRNVGSDNYSTRDGRGEVTEVLGHARSGGRTFTMTDTASDLDLVTMIDGEGRTFYVEVYSKVYAAGSNAEDKPSGYVQQKLYSCMGRSAGPSRGRGFTDRAYEITATPGGGYNTDEVTTVLTPTEYTALSLREY